MISFAIARLFDVKLERFSITALIISLGMLVDCAIEICDNVHRLQDEGYSRYNAVVEGAKQVAWPDFNREPDHGFRFSAHAVDTW